MEQTRKEDLKGKQKLGYERAQKKVKCSKAKEEIIKNTTNEHQRH